MLSYLMDFISGRMDGVTFVIQLFAVLAVLLVAFPIHECSHGFAAKLLGDDTAEMQGRLTLNPIAHLDPFGTFSMLLFGIGWAKPVPVNPTRCRKVKAKTAMALTAAAGPISNILLSYIFIIIAKIVFYGFLNGDNATVVAYVYVAISQVAIINLYLAVFNLIPVPPFDGSRLFLAFLPSRIYFKIMRYERYIMIGIMLLLWTGILSGPLSWITNLLFNGLSFLSGFVDIIFAAV